MKQQHTTLYRFLFEQEEEATDTDEFGKWFAPHSRRLRGNAYMEPNTDVEQQVQDDLETFLSNNNPKDLEANRGHEILLKLAKAGKYKQVLDPAVPAVWRGMRFPDPAKMLTYLKSLGVSSMEVQTNPRDPATSTMTLDQVMALVSQKKPVFFHGAQGGITYKPARAGGVSSWTSASEKAYYFTQGVGGRFAALVFYAGVSGNNFFGRPGELGKLGNYEDEMEVIGVGEIKGSNLTYRGTTNPELFEKVIKEFDSLHMGGTREDLWSEGKARKKV